MYLKHVIISLILCLGYSIVFGQNAADTLNTSLEIKKYKNNATTYKANFVFQIGGESKLTILPKFNFLRVHNLSNVSPYYGVEAGVHPLFVAGAYSLSALTGIEKKFVFIETSISYLRTTKVKDYKNDLSGHYSQNQLNFKLGFKIKEIRIKLGASLLIHEGIPDGQSRIPILDIGKIGNNIYGIEIQFKIR